MTTARGTNVAIDTQQMKPLLSLVLVFAACRGTAEAVSATPADQRVATPVLTTPTVAVDALLPSDDVSAVQKRMHLRLAAVTHIATAIALGDLPRAQSEAKLLMVIEEPVGLTPWRPFLERIRIAAANVANAKDLDATAGAATELAAQCGNCHMLVAGQAHVPPLPARIQGKTLAQQMAQHQWAAALMWDGLVGPSDERWRQGARTLSTIRIDLAERQLALGIWVSRVRAQAKAALNPPSGDARALMLREMLVNCVGCHRAMREP